jgi:hypothetical protein
VICILQHEVNCSNRENTEIRIEVIVQCRLISAEKWPISIGTSGRFSFIPRDIHSWNRVKYSAMRSVIELMDYDPTDQVILLIPDPRQTNLTIASLFGIAYDLYDPINIHVALDMKITTQFLRMQRDETLGISEKIKAKALSTISPIVQRTSDLRVIHLLESIEQSGKRVNIAGPPFWLDRIIERMKKEGKSIFLINI